MKSLGKALAALALVPVLVSGCSALSDRVSSGSMSGSTTACVVAGAVGGASASALVDGGIGGAVVGGLAGAVMGDVICGSGFEPDADADGVPDSRDKCPGTPKGVKVFSNGCPLDTDADGVPDYLDQCPNTPRGATVDGNGCPLDSDGDGVPDGIDKCANTPKGVKVDADGCAKVNEVMMTIEDVNFAFDSAALLPSSKAVLDKAVTMMKANSNMKFELAGHADSTGPDAYNQKLSERRAKSVMKYLVGKGIDASRLVVKGYGETRPKATNATREGRAMNRRVEIVVLSK